MLAILGFPELLLPDSVSGMGCPSGSRLQGSSEVGGSLEVGTFHISFIWCLYAA